MLYADGYQLSLPIFNASGGTVTLIGGIPGQGKSSALKLIASGFANTSTCLIWLDPKSGSDATDYEARVNVFKDPVSTDEYLSVLRTLCRMALRRNWIASSGFSINLLPRVILMVDEWSLLSALGSKAMQIDTQAELRKK